MEVPERSRHPAPIGRVWAARAEGTPPGDRPEEGGARMAYNHHLEDLERKLYEQLNTLLDAERWDAAAKVVELLASCGLI